MELQVSSCMTQLPCSQAQSKAQAATSSCDSTQALPVLPATGRAPVSLQGRGHSETHRKHSRGQKKGAKSVKEQGNGAGAAPAAQEGTGSIPAVTFSPQTEFRESIFTFSSSFNRFSSSFFLFSSSFALENKDGVNCQPAGRGCWH